MFQAKKNMSGVAVLYAEFFGHTGTCTRTGTLPKVLESTPSGRPTKVMAYVAAF